LAQVIWLFSYINTTNRNLARFLLFLKEEDASIVFVKDKVEKTFKGLDHSFKKINEEIKQMRLEKEHQTVLLQYVVDHLGVGILAYTENGDLRIINKAFKDMFDVEYLIHFGDLNEKHHDLAEFVEKIPINKKETFSFKTSWDESLTILIKVTGFKIGAEYMKLVLFQNIKSELEEKEIESWQKLIRVLIHEISNSVTPIVTLGSTIKRRLTPVSESRKMELTVDMTNDIVRSAALIEQRGNGLIDFVNNYKNFTKLPKPELKVVQIADMFRNIEKFFENQILKYKIDFVIDLKEKSLKIMMDQKLIEQVLINLIQNSFEALKGKEEGIIILTANKSEKGNIYIEVLDNGAGIHEDIIDRIFIPFYTTREKGSGIGLSLSKNIMHLHGGSLFVKSDPDRETVFTLKFGKMVASSQ